MDWSLILFPGSLLAMIVFSMCFPNFALRDLWKKRTPVVEYQFQNPPWVLDRLAAEREYARSKRRQKEYTVRRGGTTFHCLYKYEVGRESEGQLYTLCAGGHYVRRNDPSLVRVS